MYDAFDQFLNAGTWQTTHPLDERRFFRALHSVVQRADFSPDDMGRYFVKRLNLVEGSLLNEDIQRYVSKAWAVREYLTATCGD